MAPNECILILKNEIILHERRKLNKRGGMTVGRKYAGKEIEIFIVKIKKEESR